MTIYSSINGTYLNDDYLTSLLVYFLFPFNSLTSLQVRPVNRLKTLGNYCRSSIFFTDGYHSCQSPSQQC